MKRLLPLAILALTVAACIASSTDSDGKTHFQDSASKQEVATQAPDGPIVVTPQGAAAGYHVEPQVDGSDLLVGPNPTAPFLPWVPAPFQPLVGVAGLIAARMASKAGRKAAGNAFASAAKLNGQDFLADLGSALGVRADETDSKVALNTLVNKGVAEGWLTPDMTVVQMQHALEAHEADTYGKAQPVAIAPAA